MLAGHLDVLVDQLRLVCDELSPENVDEGLGEEFEPVALVTVIEHQEKVWPDVVDVRGHQ